MYELELKSGVFSDETHVCLTLMTYVHDSRYDPSPAALCSSRLPCVMSAVLSQKATSTPTSKGTFQPGLDLPGTLSQPQTRWGGWGRGRPSKTTTPFHLYKCAQDYEYFYALVLEVNTV